MDRFFYINLALVIVLSVSSCAVQRQPAMRLELLGEVVIPYNRLFENTPIGGLSGLAYDAHTDAYFVISDDRSELAPARFYRFRLQLNDEGKLEEDGIIFEDVTILKTGQEITYKRGTVDPEGITIGPDSLIYIASEGGRNKEKAPFINAYHNNGTLAKKFIMPGAYWASEKKNRSTQGIRTNLAFESLTLTPDGKTLFAATENALMQDGEAADSTSESPARIIAYELASGKVLHEYQYMVDKVYSKPGRRGPFSVNGLSDLMALDSRNLLALERNYVEGQGNHILLYQVKIDSATDIKGMSNMDKHPQPITPVKKKMIADLSTYNMTIDNYEGLVLGPDLPGGGRLLLIVSDNNFSDEQQTIFTAFRMRDD